MRIFITLVFFAFFAFFAVKDFVPGIVLKMHSTAKIAKRYRKERACASAVSTVEY
jgi:hypothetical protein